MNRLSFLSFSIFVTIGGLSSAFGQKSICGVDNINYYTNIKKIRVLDIEDVERKADGHIAKYKVYQASVGWQFGFDAIFKNINEYKASCCEFRQDLAAYWIKDNKQDLGDGKNGFSQTNHDFRNNLLSWPIPIEDTGGAYGHRDRILKGDSWQGYSSNSYFMTDEPGTGGAKKSHDVSFKFVQKIIDTCNADAVVASETRLLRDVWSYFDLNSADLVRDLDD